MLLYSEINITWTQSHKKVFALQNCPFCGDIHTNLYLNNERKSKALVKVSNYPVNLLHNHGQVPNMFSCLVEIICDNRPGS